MTIRRGMPVLVLPGGDYLKRGRVDVAALDPFDSAGVLTTRLASNWRHVPVAHLRPHWLVAEVGALPGPDVSELDFPCPPCTRCHVETYHDGDGFTCSYCLARWSSNGMDGVLPCVEDGDHEATVTGADGQPRCTLCEVQVRANLIDPSGPYDCARCRREVHGIGPDFNSAAARNRRCGMCQESADRDEYIERLIGRRAESTTGGGP